MEFDHRNQHSSTSDASREHATTPGKATLTERIPPSVSGSTRDDIGTRTPASPVPVSSGPRPSLQMLFRSRSPAADPEQVQAVAARGTATAATRLPYIEQIQRSFGKHGISGVQAHAGADATATAQEMGATAYATGNHVVLGAGANLHTVAHEAAHVVQQRAGVQLAGGVGAAGDVYEQHADAVADRVVRGESAEALLDQHAGDGSDRASVQRQPADEEAPLGAAPARTSSPARGQLAHLLSAPWQPGQLQIDPLVTYCSGLDMHRLLDEVSDAIACGYGLKLEARCNSSPRLMAAISVAELVDRGHVTPSHSALQRAGAALDQVPSDQQSQILAWMLKRGSVSVEATTLVEGVLAMREQGADRQEGTHAGGAEVAGVGPSAGVTSSGTSAPKPVEPGPWAPPGDQWPGFYVGNEAHKKIADHYQATHGADVVRANYFPVFSILRVLRDQLGHLPNESALTDTERNLKPDIVNLKQLHLYEIKPVAAQAEGAAKASLMIGLFGRAGIAMQLGPVGDPGTQGGASAPAGVFMFWSPEPGVIVYEYRKGRLVPVPVPAPESARERRWRFELKPLTREQQHAAATLTLGAALLLVAMLILAPA